MSKITDIFDRKGNSDFCERQLKRIHLEILDVMDSRNLSKCGMNCSAFEFLGDGRTQQETIIAVADDMRQKGLAEIHVPQYIRDYVINTYSASYCIDFNEEIGVAECGF